LYVQEEGGGETENDPKRVIAPTLCEEISGVEDERALGSGKRWRGKRSNSRVGDGGGGESEGCGLGV